MILRIHSQPESRPAVESISLRRLFPSASFVGCRDLRVAEACEDSRRCGPGTLFVARPGVRTDGAAFVAEAAANGACGVLTGRPIADAPIPQCVVPEVARSYGVLAATLAGRPMRLVKTVGVTGTNGKTTVAWLIRCLLKTAGLPCGLLGTVENSDGVRHSASTLTTPPTGELWDWFGSMASAGTGHAAIELSSHALHQDRCAGAELAAAVVTNVAHDHLDYHGDADGYRAAKSRILSLVRTGGQVVLNQDDPSTPFLRSRVPAGVDLVTFGLSRRAAVSASDLTFDRGGQSFVLRLRNESVEVVTGLPGRHNVMNCLAAVAAVEALGLTLEQIAAGLRKAQLPPGRLQKVGGKWPVGVYVDYAHTPDALANALDACRDLTRGRVILVFGAGGDRDRAKRPLLGAASAAADVVFVTDDNPRGEEPPAIHRQILDGMKGDGMKGDGMKGDGMKGDGPEVFVEPDRANAISLAIGLAEPGDLVLVAGKGHEKTQTYGATVIPFDDCQVAGEALRRRFGSPRARKVAA